MKQILQNLSTGKTELVEVPCPSCAPGHVLIRSVQTLVSAGTERMLIDFGKANLIEKARQQPEKVRMVIDKIRTDGLLPTIEAVRDKLDKPLPMGYCNAGVVIDVGAGVTRIKVGDRVASNGRHAEVVCVPENLCAKIPDAVDDDQASFVVIGAIALQGIRLTHPTLGEAVVVIGLGLIGLITVQLLHAQGCRVLGADIDPSRLALAREYGATTVDLSAGEDILAAAAAFSRGRGVDAVLITASAKSAEPIQQAAQMCRKRGRIVLVGVVNLTLSRSDFYEKELTFQVSCSYGPGRYDPSYEERGHDYPFGLVRWTEQRNFEAVLDMIEHRRIDVSSLISHRFAFERATEAYELVAGNRPSLGILLSYQASTEARSSALRSPRVVLNQPGRSAKGDPVFGFIGAGNYASRVLAPAFKRAGARLKSIASSGGVTGTHAGRKLGFEMTTTEPRDLLNDPEISAVVIATRHDSHARLVCDALEAGKDVFCEKPLAISRVQLEEIVTAYSTATGLGHTPRLMVGFNRRFAPQAIRARTLLAGLNAPKSIVMTINAGAIPPDHWTQDANVGGGRLIGEGCHFVDLARFLAGSAVIGVQGTMIGDASGHAVREDKASFTLTFEDGSFATIAYLANGHKSFAKERIEVFCGGRILQLENFRRLIGYGWPHFARMNLWRQDKGNAACAAAFVQALRDGMHSPIPFSELAEVTRISFDVVDSLQLGVASRGSRGLGMAES